MAAQVMRGVVIFLFATAAFAQVTLTGHVTNENQVPLPEATVTIVPASGEGKWQVFTDAAGVFHVELPRPGDYVFSAQLTGYYKLENRRITIMQTPGEVQLVLNRITEIAESVNVTASTTSVDLDQTYSDQQITGNDMMNIPYPVDHSLQNATRLLPGVVQDNLGGMHLNGGAQEQTLYLLDGFKIADPLSGQFSTRLSLEGVQSMDLVTGTLPAEYGDTSAGVMTVNTKMGDDHWRYSGTNFIPGVVNEKGLRIGNWFPRFYVSGPLRKTRAWFSDDFGGEFAQNIINELPPGQDRSTTVRYNNYFRTQINLTAHNILQAGFLTNFLHGALAGLSPLDPPSTTLTQSARQYFGNVKDQIYLGHGGLIEVGFASNRTYAGNTPQGRAPYVYTPQGRSGNYFQGGNAAGGRDELLANVFLPSFTAAGAHQVKMGVDLDRISYSQDFFRTSIFFYRGNGTLARSETFAGSGEFNRAAYDAAAYAQDSWRIRSNVLIEPGIRLDWMDVLHRWTVSPRIGVSWTPPHLSQTKISLGYAFLYDQPPLQLFTRPQDQVSINDFFQTNGSSGPPMTTLYAVPAGLSMPQYHTWNVGLDHRLPANIYAHFQLLGKRGSSGLSYFNAPELATAPNQIVYALESKRHDEFDSYQLTLRQTFHKQYEWLASYTRSRTYSSAVTGLGLDDPYLVANNAGPLPWDSPNRFLSWAYLPTFWKNWAVAYLFEMHTGFPFSINDAQGNVVGPADSYRFPTFMELDFHIERRFHFRGQIWAARAGYNNITSHNNPNVVNNNIDGPQFRQFSGGQGRALVFRIRWLGKV